MMNNIIEVKNLGISYPNNGFSLKNISFTVPKGSIVGIIGENGSGKTTAINSLLGIRKKDTGSVKIFGQEFDNDNTLIKEKIGVSFEEVSLPSNLTAKEVSDIYKNFYKNWDNIFFINTLDKFGIDQRKKISDYSKGMQKMFSIILSMSHNPELLILDEPTSSLDPVRRQEILEIFQEFIENGENSIMFSSHITTDIEHISDFVVYINKGEVVFYEPITRLLYDYALVKCTEEVFRRLPSDKIIAYHKKNYEHAVLMNSRESLQLIGDDLLIENPTLEEIMNIYSKGIAI